MSYQLAAVTYVFERRWLPSPDGSLTLRASWTNVPRHVAGPTPFDWAATGSGAYALALNVLEDTLRAADHGGPTSSHAGTTCFTLSLILRDAFVEQFIATLPDEGGALTREAVGAWITAQERTLDPLLAEILAPRFTDGRDTWTTAELEQISGEHLACAPGGLLAIEGTLVARRLTTHPVDAAPWESCPL